MVNFGNMSEKQGIEEYYKNLVREAFSDGTTYISPDNHQKHYSEQAMNADQLFGYVSPEAKNRIARAQTEFNSEAVTYLQQGTEKEVEKMLENTTIVTPDGIDAGMTRKRKKKTEMTKE